MVGCGLCFAFNLPSPHSRISSQPPPSAFRSDHSVICLCVQGDGSSVPVACADCAERRLIRLGRHLGGAGGTLVVVGNSGAVVHAQKPPASKGRKRRRESQSSSAGSSSSSDGSSDGADSS